MSHLHSVIVNFIFLGIGLCTLLFGCTNGGAYLLGPQQWENVNFLVEVRPGPPKKGMNEFIIIATDLNHRAAFDYVISIKSNSENKWTQSIQDGHSGAYRRAINVNDPQKDTLFVLVKNNASQQTVLEFPLNQTALN